MTFICHIYVCSRSLQIAVFPLDKKKNDNINYNLYKYLLTIKQTIVVSNRNLIDLNSIHLFILLTYCVPIEKYNLK